MIRSQTRLQLWDSVNCQNAWHNWIMGRAEILLSPISPWLGLGECVKNPNTRLTTLYLDHFTATSTTGIAPAHNTDIFHYTFGSLAYASEGMIT